MSNRVILDHEDFPIRPSDISLASHFFDAFGHMETEVSARHIVRLMQERGGWASFTPAQIDAADLARRGLSCTERGTVGFTWNRLLGRLGVEEADEFWPQNGVQVPCDAFIAEDRDGRFRVTDAFILNCYKASPIARLKPSAEKEN